MKIECGKQMNRAGAEAHVEINESCENITYGNKKKKIVRKKNHMEIKESYKRITCEKQTM